MSDARVEKRNRLPKGPKGWQLLTVALAREHFIKNGSAPIYGKTFQDGLFYDDDDEDENDDDEGEEKTPAALLRQCDTELRLYGHLIEQKMNPKAKDPSKQTLGYPTIHLDWLLDKTKTGPYPDKFVRGTKNQVMYHLFGVQTDTEDVDYMQHIQIYQDPPNVIGNNNDVFFWVPTEETIAKYNN